MREHKHRIVKRNGVWMMYCPKRRSGDLIYTASFRYVLLAIRDGGPCPHDDILTPAMPLLWP